jgi:starch phosphorylase
MSNLAQHYGNPISSLQTAETEGFDSLVSLALDMRWSWNHTADELWSQLDPALWNETHNPWLVIQSVSDDQVKRLLHHRLSARNWTPSSGTAGRRFTAWLVQNESSGYCPKNHGVFQHGVHAGEALPIYVGGLGNVAGDQLKSASDLGVPVTGIGLLYQQGYFRQYIDESGEQQAFNPFNDPGQLPVTPLRGPNGEWVRVEITLRGEPLWLRAWQVQAGRAKLYLLDSNDAANLSQHREITGEVYGGDQEMRIRQEIVLGIGGWKLLEQLGISPEVCHLNEGHAAFAVLERAASYMRRTGENFETAMAVTRAGNLFTTHTAVAAGFDHFDPSLVTRYLGDYAQKTLGITPHDLLALGRQDPDNAYEGFQHGVAGCAWQQGYQWRQQTAWPGQPSSFRTFVQPLADRRSSGGPCHQWRTRSDLGVRSCGPVVGRCYRQRPVERDDGSP